MWIFTGRAFQAEGTANAKALRNEHFCHVRGTVKRPVQLKWSKQGEE